MDNISKKPWGWLVAGLLAAYVAYFFVFAQGARSRNPLPIGPITVQQTPVATIRVHVTGAVKSPGVYTLPAQARIQDAIHKAGGPLPGANVNALNLADWATDGSKIEVPLKSPPAAPKADAQPIRIAQTTKPSRSINRTRMARSSKTSSAASPPSNSTTGVTPDSSSQQVYITSPASSYTSPGIAPDGSISNAGSTHRRRRAAAPKPLPKSSTQYLTQLSQNPVNLNTASPADLERLPGIGPKMADRILTYRNTTGGFRSVDELNNVPGFGDKKLAQLQGLICVQ